MSCHVHYRQAMKHRLALIFGLTALTALLFAADLTAGSSGMPLSAVLNALWAGPSGQSPEALILWSLRLPMTLTALFVGAALALAGLQIQTITANALASPSTLGITSGASFGAALAITAGFTVGGELWLGTMTASFLASLLICALILALGEDAGTLEDVYEPYLLMNGLLNRTPRGRMATEAAYRHLGYAWNQEKNGISEI